MSKSDKKEVDNVERTKKFYARGNTDWLPAGAPTEVADK